MEFLRSALGWFGDFLGGLFQDIRQQVYYRTGSAGVLGFILIIFKKWYIIVMVPAITALYWILKAFDDMGILDSVENFVVHQLDMIVDVARYCTPKLFDKEALIQCLNDPTPSTK